MTRSTDIPDPLRADLEQAYSLYVQLAARVAPGQGQAGRRLPPGSRPPLDVRMVSHMQVLEQTLAAWIGQARWLLDPWQKVDLTAREGIRCPYCNGALVAWLRPSGSDAEGDGEVVCTSLDHREEEGPRRWTKRDWPRLGVLAGVHEDGRFTATHPPERRPA